MVNLKKNKLFLLRLVYVYVFVYEVLRICVVLKGKIGFDWGILILIEFLGYIVWFWKVILGFKKIGIK